MRSLGLDGRVGAPAIVKQNPLFAAYDAFRERHEAWSAEPPDPYCEGSCRDRRYDDLARSFLPFSWRDVLGVVQDRYVGSQDPVLYEFLRSCSNVIPDPVLVYALETPLLSVTLGWDGENAPLGVLRGSCRSFDCYLGLVSGETEHVTCSSAVLLSPVKEISFLRSGFGTCPPDLEIDSPLCVRLSGHSVWCSAIPVDYPLNDTLDKRDHELRDFLKYWPIVCAPGDLPGLHHPDRSFMDLVDDPLALRSAMLSLESSLKEWRSTSEYQLLHERTRSDSVSPIYKRWRRFTPGGASR